VLYVSLREVNKELRGKKEDKREKEEEKERRKELTWEGLLHLQWGC
jgi:hypothetical protein